MHQNNYATRGFWIVFHYLLRGFEPFVEIGSLFPVFNNMIKFKPNLLCVHSAAEVPRNDLDLLQALRVNRDCNCPLCRITVTLLLDEFLSRTEPDNNN